MQKTQTYLVLQVALLVFGSGVKSLLEVLAVDVLGGLSLAAESALVLLILVLGSRVELWKGKRGEMVKGAKKGKMDGKLDR